MKIWFDPSMNSEAKNKAELIVSTLGLEDFNLRVRVDQKNSHLTFTLDRRVVDVPMSLVDTNGWKDIRFLFRAILGAAPSAWNLTADENDWSAFR